MKEICFKPYINSGGLGYETTPQKVQNLVIREYCRKNGIRHSLSITEFNIGERVVLRNLLNEHPPGLVFYSVELFPSEHDLTTEIWERVLDTDFEVHFALEEIAVTNEEQLKNFQDLNLYRNFSSTSIEILDSGKQHGKLKKIVTSLHKNTKRNYLERMNSEKPGVMDVSAEYGADYWDGDRKFGYGGYTYDGRWSSIAKTIIEEYDLDNNSKVLDVGCGKGFLLFEIKKILPGITVEGFDISSYAIENSKTEITGFLKISDAKKVYSYPDKYFDLVLSINVFHNFKLKELKFALQEFERIGKRKYICVESYRNNQELMNLQCWALTCQAFFDIDNWVWMFKEFGYTGDYEFIFFE